MKNFSLIVCLCILGAAGGAAQRVSQTLTFRAGADNMPLSQAEPPSGFEMEFARAPAKRMGAQAEFVWLGAHADSFEQAVLNGRCDAALGAIVDGGKSMAGSRTLPGVVFTKPNYAAGYVLIRRSGASKVHSLAELGDRHVANETESIVAYTLLQLGHQVHLLRNAEAVIAAVAEGRGLYRYLCGPAATWRLRGRGDVVAAPEFESTDKWWCANETRPCCGL